MRIAVLGTGMVGRTLAGALVARGHEVAIGTRDVAGTLACTEPDAMGTPPLSAWLEQQSQVPVLAYPAAAEHGELVVNATSGRSSVGALTAAGAANLAGKVLLDVANPLDFSAGMPPGLDPVGRDSLGEQIQRAFPDARVVKSLNTMNAAVMVDPARAGGESSVFVAGNDAAAKATVTDLLRSFGWSDVVDLGDITGARGAEMLLPIWLRLMATLGTADFNFRIVR